MKKNTFYLLAISILLIFSVKSYAQMQSVINTSTHRTITIPLQGKINPIKSLAVKPSVILSIVKFTPYNITLPIYSIFYLTDDGINTMSGPNYATNFSILYNIETTDIKGGDEEVFFLWKKIIRTN